MKNNMKSILQGMNMAKLMDDEDIRAKIVIQEEFKGLIPPLTDEELDQLEQNILKEGVRDPLILWPIDDKFILIDGHNRFSICVKHNLQFPFKKIEFKDSDDAKAWMVKNQLGRRNLSKENQSYLRGLRYHQEKHRGPEIAGAQNGPQGDGRTADRLADEYNVSKNTIKRDAQFVTGVDLIGLENPEVKKDILNGSSKIKMQDIQAVGQKKKKVKELFHVDQEDKGTPKIKITPESVAKIAFSFISQEQLPLSVVTQKIGVDPAQNPLDFFITWSNTKR